MTIGMHYPARTHSHIHTHKHSFSESFLALTSSKSLRRSMEGKTYVNTIHSILLATTVLCVLHCTQSRNRVGETRGKQPLSRPLSRTTCHTTQHEHHVDSCVEQFSRFRPNTYQIVHFLVFFSVVCFGWTRRKKKLKTKRNSATNTEFNLFKNTQLNFIVDRLASIIKLH